MTDCPYCDGKCVTMMGKECYPRLITGWYPHGLTAELTGEIARLRVDQAVLKAEVSRLEAELALHRGERQA